MHSELVQRWMDYFCLDHLCNEFDLEYWDCSDFVLPSFHFDKKIERDYVRKIHSLFDLWRNLRRLPKDALISNDVHFNEANFWYHILLSHYFPKINYINFYSNVPDKRSDIEREHYRFDQGGYNLGAINIFAKIRRLIYANRDVQFAIQYIMHPNKIFRNDILSSYYNDLYTRYEISCCIGAKYHINHPDVDNYIKYKRCVNIPNEEKIMVYIDQFFPYHLDIKEFYSGKNIEKLASDFYRSLNNFFEIVEKKYECKVIIAAHPLSNYTINPYNGRELKYNSTVDLIAKSYGVLMHSSNALSYVMLFRKPLLMLENKEIREIPFTYNPIVNTSDRFHIPRIDIDEQKDFTICQLDELIYKTYIQTYFGDVDEKDEMESNKELLRHHLISVWHEMYD